MITLLLVAAVVAWIVVTAIKGELNPVLAFPVAAFLGIVLIGGGTWAQSMVAPAVQTSARWEPLTEVDGAFVVSTVTTEGVTYSYFTESESGKLEEHLVSNVALAYGDLATVTVTSQEHPGGPWFWPWSMPAGELYDIQVPKGGLVR